MAEMVRKENLEHQVLLAALVPMVLTDSLAKREKRAKLAPREPLDHKVGYADIAILPTSSMLL